MLKNIKKHFKNDPKDIKKLCQCSECEHIYSREHVIWCDWYKNLRENKDLSNCVDLTCYFQQFLCLPRNYRGQTQQFYRSDALSPRYKEEKIRNICFFNQRPLVELRFGLSFAKMALQLEAICSGQQVSFDKAVLLPSLPSWQPSCYGSNSQAVRGQDSAGVNSERKRNLKMSEQEDPSSCSAPCKTREDPPYFTQTELLLKVEDKQKLIDFRARFVF